MTNLDHAAHAAAAARAAAAKFDALTTATVCIIAAAADAVVDAVLDDDLLARACAIWVRAAEVPDRAQCTLPTAGGEGDDADSHH